MNARLEERERELEADRDWQEYCDSHSIPDCEDPGRREFGNRSTTILLSTVREIARGTVVAVDGNACTIAISDPIPLAELNSILSRCGIRDPTIMGPKYPYGKTGLLVAGRFW
ncbi:MAG: hypothetical protein MPJ22_00285 [Pirellulales bacterium]|nr:hypothetical protein [Pirellulales bacterium]